MEKTEKIPSDPRERKFCCNFTIGLLKDLLEKHYLTIDEYVRSVNNIKKIYKC